MEKLSALANDNGGKASRNLWGMCIEEFLTNFPFILLLNLGIPRVKRWKECVVVVIVVLDLVW